MASIFSRNFLKESFSNQLGALESIAAAAKEYSISLNVAAQTKEGYVKQNLADEMRKHRGKKRLRKKKAKRALLMRWGFMQMGRLLASRRINYAEIARKLVVVDPLPDPVKPIYMRNIDTADVVTGGEE